VSEVAKSAAIDEAIERFNRGEYFEAAEMFELEARGADGELKVIIDSLNRVAAALHLRFERGGRQAAINLISQAMLALEDLRPARAGLDIDRLYEELHAYNEEIRATPRGEHDGLKHRARLFLERRRAPKINRVR
jgi:predicted metal-dependent hydrolase